MKQNKKQPIALMAISFLLGWMLILYPQIGDVMNKFTASTAIKEYSTAVESLKDPSAKDLLDEAILFNKHLVEGTVKKGEDTCITMKDGVIAYLDIPKIKVYLPIYYGTSADVLEKGCGYIKNTSLPVGGESCHSVISGHTGLPSAELLSDLDDLVIGDVFYIHVLNEVLAYKVEQIKVVKPEETEQLRIVPGKDYVTLLTCTPYGINDHRLLVRGVRTTYTAPDNSQDTGTQQVINQEKKVNIGKILIQIGVASIVVILAIRSLRKRSNETKRENPANSN